MITVQFLITSLVVVLIPGTGVVYTISTGLFQKSKASIYAAIGCTLGIIPHLFACFLGLSAIMHLSATVFVVIKYAGCLYLLYLATKTWKNAGKTQFIAPGNSLNSLSLIWKGILLNILNPKLTLFFLSFLPQFIPANATNTSELMLVLSGVFMFMTLIVFIAYGLLASTVSTFIQTSTSMMKRIEKGFALIFAGLAVKLAIPEK
jgi:threonine/homoserine/homoserine lactone efflux protein